MLGQKLFVLLSWQGVVSVGVCERTVSKWEPTIYIKYGIFIPGLFAAAEGNTSICGQQRRGGGEAGQGN